jgi:hypothetical protein
MVKAENDSTYLKLKERFNQLQNNSKVEKVKKLKPNVVNLKQLLMLGDMKNNTLSETHGVYSKKNNIDKVLDTLFEKGLDEAMKLYKK